MTSIVVAWSILIIIQGIIYSNQVVWFFMCGAFIVKLCDNLKGLGSSQELFHFNYRDG